MVIFKAYDIRGIYPTELNDETAYKIGRAFVSLLKCESVVVGRDGRESSPAIFEALTKGITDQGADVVDIGLASTPMLYFAAKKAPAAIMITASHCTKEYNGFKLCRERVVPISEADGIREIESLVNKNEFVEPAKKGVITQKNVMNEYIQFNLSFCKATKEFKIVVDAGNGMASYTFPKHFEKLGFEFIPLFCEMDFNFPNHEANPLKLETLKFLQEKVIAEKADLGIALDGDADRCAFVDEKGEIVTNDLTTALIAKEILKQKPGATVLFDLRSSKSTSESIQENGGKGIMCRVGHTFIKAQMRKEDADFAGELSGHYYYKDSFFAESSFITTAIMLNLLEQENKPLSELIAPLRRYHASGEINFEVHDKDGVIKNLESRYKDAKKVLYLDGLSVEFDDWWFNVRKSNTDPVLRLNLEAKSKEMMEEKVKEIKEMINL